MLPGGVVEVTAELVSAWDPQRVLRARSALGSRRWCFRGGTSPRGQRLRGPSRSVPIRRPAASRSADPATRSEDLFVVPFVCIGRIGLCTPARRETGEYREVHRTAPRPVRSVGWHLAAQRPKDRLPKAIPPDLCGFPRGQQHDRIGAIGEEFSPEHRRGKVDGGDVVTAQPVPCDERTRCRPFPVSGGGIRTERRRGRADRGHQEHGEGQFLPHPG